MSQQDELGKAVKQFMTSATEAGQNMLNQIQKVYGMDREWTFPSGTTVKEAVDEMTVDRKPDERKITEMLKNGGMNTEDAMTSARILVERLAAPEWKLPVGINYRLEVFPDSDDKPVFTEGDGINLANSDTDKEDGSPTASYPQSMRVGSKFFRIYWWDSRTWESQERLGRDNKGKTHPESSSVHIRTSIIYDHEPTIELEYGLQDMAETLIHEAIHCMYTETMLEKNPVAKGGKYRQEEYVTQVLAPMMTALMQDNPELVAWIQAARTA